MERSHLHLILLGLWSVYVTYTNGEADCPILVAYFIGALMGLPQKPRWYTASFLAHMVLFFWHVVCIIPISFAPFTRLLSSPFLVYYYTGSAIVVCFMGHLNALIDARFKATKMRLINKEETDDDEVAVYQGWTKLQTAFGKLVKPCIAIFLGVPIIGELCAREIYFPTPIIGAFYLCIMLTEVMPVCSLLSPVLNSIGFGYAIIIFFMSRDPETQIPADAVIVIFFTAMGHFYLALSGSTKAENVPTTDGLPTYAQVPKTDNKPEKKKNMNTCANSGFHPKK